MALTVPLNLHIAHAASDNKKSTKVGANEKYNDIYPDSVRPDTVNYDYNSYDDNYYSRG